MCFHGPDKYFVKFYICISSCVRVLNMKRCFNGKVYFFSYLIFYENVPSGFKTRHVFKLDFKFYTFKLGMFISVIFPDR